MRKLAQSPALNFQRGCFIFVAAAWTLFSCMFALLGLCPALIGLLAGSVEALVFLFPALFALPFLAVGVGMLVWALRPLIASIRVAKPEISVSNATPRIGEEFFLSFAQTYKQATDVARIAVQLVFRESASYRSNKSRHTVTHDNVVEQFEYPARHFETGDVFRFRRALTIPTNAMPTFRALNNRLLWLVRAEIQIQGWPDSVEEFEIQVLPELA